MQGGGGAGRQNGVADLQQCCIVHIMMLAWMGGWVGEVVVGWHMWRCPLLVLPAASSHSESQAVALYHRQAQHPDE